LRQALAFFFVALKTFLAGLSKDQQNLLGLFDLGTHPFDPALFGVLHILVNPDFDSVSSELVSQRKDALRVFRRVVTVTDKNFGGIRRHLPFRTFLSDLTGFVSSLDLTARSPLLALRRRHSIAGSVDGSKRTSFPNPELGWTTALTAMPRTGGGDRTSRFQAASYSVLITFHCDGTGSVGPGSGLGRKLASRRGAESAGSTIDVSSRNICECELIVQK